MSKNLASESKRYKWGAKKLSLMVRFIYCTLLSSICFYFIVFNLVTFCRPSVLP